MERSIETDEHARQFSIRAYRGYRVRGIAGVRASQEFVARRAHWEELLYHVERTDIR